MADWWDEPAPEPVNGAGHTSAQIDAITAQAIAAEPATRPDRSTPNGKLAAFLLPGEAPLAVSEAAGPRGMMAICRDDAHAEAVSEAAAVAGLRVEPWTLDAVWAVLRAGTAAPVAAILGHFPGGTVRKRAGRIPEDDIPFGGGQEAAE